MKCCLLVGAFVCSVALVLQCWFAMTVFSHDLSCRQSFTSSPNSTSVNQLNCENSLKNVIAWHCHCRPWLSNSTFVIRCFDEWSVMFAAVIVIIVVVIEIIRSPSMLSVICGHHRDIDECTSFEYLSFVGFFALILNTNIVVCSKKLSHFRLFGLLPDILTTILIFRYCAFTGTQPEDDTLWLTCLIFTFFDILVCLTNTFFANFKPRTKTDMKPIPPPSYIDANKNS